MSQIPRDTAQDEASLTPQSLTTCRIGLATTGPKRTPSPLAVGGLEICPSWRSEMRPCDSAWRPAGRALNSGHVMNTFLDVGGGLPRARFRRLWGSPQAPDAWRCQASSGQTIPADWSNMTQVAQTIIARRADCFHITRSDVWWS